MFEWDNLKNRSNYKKHGIWFEEAKEIFIGTILSFEDSRKNYGEKRTISVGAIDQEVVIVVVHTDRKGITRIISARKANKKERRLYFERI